MANAANDTLSASMEDYLEAIYHEIEENQVARVKDVAARLKVNKSSVSGALHTLSNQDMVSHDPYGLIRLTPKGRQIAQDVARRHEALRYFLVDVLGIEEAEADRFACVMEHTLSPIVEEHLSRFIAFIEEKNCLLEWKQQHEHFDCPCKKGSQS